MNNPNQHIKTRFAPSPTGVLHIGGLRTALFNFAFAKQHNGVFVVRIEDTDTKRSKLEYETDILKSLHATKIIPDELYRQSERTVIYRTYLEKLIKNGYAYYSKEDSEGEDRRSEVIRFKNPNRIIAFDDLIRGTIQVDTTDLGDFVLAKSLDEPLYHLAVVVDDIEMQISHVIRGEDHISNTPRQILIQEALNAQRFTYAHMPLILAPDRSKLSKRNGAISTSEYIRDGFLPEALINYMAILGWSPQAKGGAEAGDIFSLSVFIKNFDIAEIQKSGAVFNKEKLENLNRYYIKELSPEALQEKIRDFLPKKCGEHMSDTLIKKLAPTIIERISFFGELGELCQKGDLDYYTQTPVYKKTLLLGKKGELEHMQTVEHLIKIHKMLDTIEEISWNKKTIHDMIWPYAEEHGRGSVLWPLRAALSGRERSTDPFTIAGILNKAEALTRIKNAHSLLA